MRTCAQLRTLQELRTSAESAAVVVSSIHMAFKGGTAQNTMSARDSPIAVYGTSQIISN